MPHLSSRCDYLLASQARASSDASSALESDWAPRRTGNVLSRVSLPRVSDRPRSEARREATGPGAKRGRRTSRDPRTPKCVHVAPWFCPPAAAPALGPIVACSRHRHPAPSAHPPFPFPAPSLALPAAHRLQKKQDLAPRAPDTACFLLGRLRPRHTGHLRRPGPGPNDPDVDLQPATSCGR